jgi:hypothetical protein
VRARRVDGEGGINRSPSSPDPIPERVWWITEEGAGLSLLVRVRVRKLVELRHQEIR